MGMGKQRVAMMQSLAMMMGAGLPLSSGEDSPHK